MHEYMGVMVTTSNRNIVEAAGQAGMGGDGAGTTIFARGRIEGEHIYLYPDEGEPIVVALCNLDAVWLDIYRVNCE